MVDNHPISKFADPPTPNHFLSTFGLSNLKITTTTTTNVSNQFKDFFLNSNLLDLILLWYPGHSPLEYDRCKNIRLKISCVSIEKKLISYPYFETRHCPISKKLKYAPFPLQWISQGVECGKNKTPGMVYRAYRIWQISILYDIQYIHSNLPRNMSSWE